MNYFANHQIAPQILSGTPMFNVEVGEGNNPPGDFYPAAYLPAVQSENRIGGTYFSLMPGKVIAYDSNKRLIPAGLAMDYNIFNAAYDAAAPGDELTDARAVAKVKYTAKDEDNGTINAQGQFAQADDYVAETMFEAGLKVTEPIGYMRYSALVANGTDPNDPTTWYKHAYDTGGAKAYGRTYYIQVPVVEVNARVEAIKENVTSHRIALYTDGGAVIITKGGVLQGAMIQLASPGLMTQVAGDPTQFSFVGRTVFFNAPTPADYKIKYTPKTNLPFACLKSTNIGDINIDVEGVSDANGVAEYLGKVIGYDRDSNYTVFNATGAGTSTGTCGAEKIGRVLDVKSGASKDLALVRTYFRDFGLWGEAPGSATDGRNAILSIANAPKYIARIAVNFNVSW